MKPDAGKPLIVRTVRAFGYAIKGVRVASRDRMFRIQLVCAAIAIALGLLVTLSAIEWCVLVLTISLVLAFEVMNTAVEAVVDLVSPEPHPLAGRAKDLAAGAVLIASIGALVVGLVLFVPRFVRALP